MTLNRRSLMLGAAAGALAAPFVRIGPAMAAEFNLKATNNQPLTHPSNIRVLEAIDRIREESGGRVEITNFPQGQLGADTDVLNQLRSGGVDFMTLVDARMTVTEFERELHGLVARYGRTLAELEMTIGRELPPAAALLVEE